MRGVAIIVLCVLISAGSSAAVTSKLITSKDIKNGTVQPVDLSAKTKWTLRGAAGPPGSQGPRGLTGERGPAGSQGPPGFQSVQLVNGPYGQIPSGSWRTLSVTCPPGTQVTGGGWVTPTPRVLIVNESRASGDNGWQVTMTNTTDYAPGFQAQAFCAGS